MAAELLTHAEVAIHALAEAMANRADPIRQEAPTSEMFERSAEVVNAILDFAGREIVVLIVDSREAAVALAAACGKDSEDDIAQAMIVLKNLAEVMGRPVVEPQ